MKDKDGDVVNKKTKFAKETQELSLIKASEKKDSAP